MNPSDLTGTYTLDPAHSRFGFVARHAMITKIHGSIPVKEAVVVLDAGDPAASRAHVVLDVAGIHTGNQYRDAHLRTGDLLDAAGHPSITFDSAGVKHAGGDDYEVTGDLTIRGVTRQVTIVMTYTGTAADAQGVTRVGFEGGTVIDRRDFGITYNAILETGGVMISDKITIELDLSAVRAT
ncbi:YceI family protein [Sphaerisporangium aureirubrum]|uniref:YceI family protein n=1 Tax=Sphaerisporangium aureirubrum TaxID=1544736 RepID=A0ABW1NQU1_9ACTN